VSEATLGACAYHGVKRDPLPQYSTNILAQRRSIFWEAEEIRKSSGSEFYFIEMHVIHFRRIY